MTREGGSRLPGPEVPALVIITVVLLAAPVVAEFLRELGMQVERARVVFLGW